MLQGQFMAEMNAKPDTVGDTAGSNMPVLLLGIVAMLASLWLTGFGGMLAKLILIGFWGIWVGPAILRGRLTGDGLVAVLLLGVLVGVVGLGDGGTDEKVRLIGNLLILPLGLICGLWLGRDCLRVMVPALILYLPMASVFQITHEGWRLNHPFLFLGLFALTCAMRRRARGWIGGVAAVAVVLSQTRIAVLALMIAFVGRVRFSRAMTWLFGLPTLIAVGVMMTIWLPRLLMTHGSGRLAFWQMFWNDWQTASSARQWLGFGAGSVEAILQDLPSAAAFGALHNDHFRILFETGLIGAILWLMGWGMLIWFARGSRLAMCVLASVVVTMVTDNTLSYGHYLICCGMAAGIAMRENADARQ